MLIITLLVSIALPIIVRGLVYLIMDIRDKRKHKRELQKIVDRFDYFLAINDERIKNALKSLGIQ